MRDPIADEDVGQTDPDTGDSPDTADTSDAGEEDISTPADVDYLACVLGESEPWDECAEQDILDFGTVQSHDTVVRRMRIDNLGGSALSVTEATIDDPNFEVLALTYTQEESPVSTEVALPADLPAGASLFFEVTVRNSNAGQALVFAADSLEILVDTGAPEPETVSIQITGDYGGCATGFANCDDDLRTGCEVNLNQDPLHCGVCRNACSGDNGDAVCAAGQCGTTCSAGFESCDSDIATGCETDIHTVADCGGCGLVCEFDNAAALCGSGTCEFDACATGWMDLNADLSDGCEYECTFQSNFDLPDITLTDSNCDGIDGDISRAIFVATTGSDTSGAGTIASPYQTIGRALTVASQVSGLDHIYVASGDYDASITLFNGISIYGGYDATDAWSRGLSNITRINYTGDTGRKIAMRGENITSPTTLGMLTISTDSVTSGNGNNTALHCKNCSTLILQNNTFSPGNAGNGQDGASGPQASGSGLVGSIGGNGQNGNYNPGQGGSGGTSGCARIGGKGGNGGVYQVNSVNSGQTGQLGVSATAGGAGSPGAMSSNFGGNAFAQPGRPGNNGAGPTDGQNGSGGSGGQLVGGFWQGLNGSDGTNGTHGNGGGGGGGSGSVQVLFGGGASGSGGGGGGGGGCRGFHGGKGSAGGSSFGLVLLDSTGITLLNNTFLGGNAGNGGKGGAGSAGSPGAAGRPGGSFNTNNRRTIGGAGGNGSRGGNAGHGGGGAGGNAYGIYSANTDPNGVLPGNNTFTPGQPGAGGTSPGTNGASGVSVNH